MKKCIATTVALVMAWPTAALAQADPVIDTKFVTDPQRYMNDLQDCHYLASQSDPGESAVSNGLGGALVGAAVGALLGAAIGGRSMIGYGARTGAAQYGTEGAVAGAATAAAMQQRIMINCMLGRGYHVLNAPLGMGAVALPQLGADLSAPPQISPPDGSAPGNGVSQPVSKIDEGTRDADTARPERRKCTHQESVQKRIAIENDYSVTPNCE